jgi:hypothetical protein
MASGNPAKERAMTWLVRGVFAAVRPRGRSRRRRIPIYRLAL